MSNVFIKTFPVVSLAYIASRLGLEKLLLFIE